MISAFDIACILLAILASGSVAYLWLSHEKTPDTAAPKESEPKISYLFDHGVLQHASDGIGEFCALEPGFHEWSDLYDFAVEMFPQFPPEPKSGIAGSQYISSSDTTTSRQIKISWDQHLCRIVVFDPDKEDPLAETDSRTLLRCLSSGLSIPVWHTNKSGKILWSNNACHELHERVYPGQPCSAQPLFDPVRLEAAKRISVRIASTQKKEWYEITNIEIQGVLCYQAICVTDLVRAEEARRNFVQTLTKTFAHLSIGLAIFDRNNQLALFNPALVDLSSLDAEFLSSRPTLHCFFDRLRENRKMPEPKNYTDWRLAISDLISAAHDGRYEETWSIDTGQTLRVRGRPHPDGATAFLIEDISAEVSLTRSFRAELELGQSLLDTLEDAIAVFSMAGVLTFSNAAYQKLWQVDPEKAFADVTIYDAVQIWKRRCAPNFSWGEIESYVGNIEDRKHWSMPLYLSEGSQMTCNISPITAGATLIRFHMSEKLTTPAVTQDLIATP